MSAEGGLHKLTEYLNQTRRQAEAAIDTLNERIFELEASNVMLKKSNDDFSIERTYLKDLVEQLKGENSRKWRLQERDDWKSLVDSVQADRVRLQEENMQLSLYLEEAQAEIEKQALLISATALEKTDSRGPSPGTLSNTRVGCEQDDEELINEDGGMITLRTDSIDEENFSGKNYSPINRAKSADSSPTKHSAASRGFDNTGAGPPVATPSPRNTTATIQQLKLELEKVNNQRQVENQMAEAEIKGLRDEIERLQHQLRHARGDSSEADFDHSPLPIVPFESAEQALSRAAAASTAAGNSQSGWSLSFGLWDYFFSSPTHENNSTAPGSNSTQIILRV